MQSTLQCFRVSLVLFSLVPSTLTFSRGANHASCQQMIPGHIRAQPLDPQHSHVTLRTSAASYLPGQLVTVTVRSSRDFMGFLLQARRVDGASAEAGVGVSGKTPVGAGVRSTRLGPALVGGSWTLTPPGTHTLRCLSEGDTLTHSDKQLKRNLSFVWRAPDVPMGDIRFYITVVQSYFVYWAGIESTVVHDGSRTTWSGSNLTGVDGGNSIFALQDDEVTALPAFRAHSGSIKQTNKTVRPATTLRPPTTITSSGTQSYKSQETPTEAAHPVLEMNSSVTLPSLRVSHVTNQAVHERNSPTNLGSLQNATKGRETDTYAPLGSLSAVTEEVVTDKGSPVTNTKDPKSSLLFFTASFSSAEVREVEGTTTILPSTTVQNSSSPLSHVSLLSLRDFDMERKQAKTKFQNPKQPTAPETTDTTLNPESTTTAILSTNHRLHNTIAPRAKSQNPRGPIQDQTTSVKFEAQSNSSKSWKIGLTKSQMSLDRDEMGSQSQSPHPKPLLHSQTSSNKSFFQDQTFPSLPLLQSETVPSQTIPLSRSSSSTLSSKSETSSANLIGPSKSPTHKSFVQFPTTSPFTQVPPLSTQSLLNKILNVPFHTQPVINLPKHQPESRTSQINTRQTSQPHTQLQTSTPLSSPTQPQPLNSFNQALPQTIPTQTKGQADFAQLDKSQSGTAPQALSVSPQPWSQGNSQTGAPEAQTFGPKQTQTSVTPRSTSPLPVTTRFDPTATLGEGKEVKDLQSQENIRNRSPIIASIPSATLSPSSSMFTHKSTPHFSSSSSTHTLHISYLVHSTPTTLPYPTGSSTVVPLQTSFTHTSISFSPSSSTIKNQPKTSPALSALPSASPIYIPPNSPSVQPSSPSTMPSTVTSSTIPSLNSSGYPSSAPLFSTSSSSPFTSSQPITSSTLSSPSSSTISPFFSTIASSTSSSPLPPHSTSTSTSSSTSLGSLPSSNSSATSSSLVSSESTSPHPEPSPAPLRST